MRKRTQAREFALKALYQRDLRGELAPSHLEMLRETQTSGDPMPFGHELIEGCLANQDALDEIIEQTAENWRLGRMPIVDRNILRLATYEMVFRHDTPPKVIINEAIELAKKYSTANSPTFVNGVLDKIYSTHAHERKDSEQDGSDEATPCGHGPRGRFTPDPQARADLHVHSSVSDGSLTPDEVVRLAAQVGLAAVALTDHDTVEGIESAERAGEEVGVQLVPGVELTAYTDEADTHGNVEVHMMGLFVDATDPEFLAELERLRQVRVDRIHTISEKLRDLGFQFDTEEILSRARGESVGRVHVAREMVKQGICSSPREAFSRFIGEGGPAYVPKERLTPTEAIQVVRKAGGCAVLAHPGLTEGIEDMLEELVRAGLDGIEVHCPGHTAQDERRFMDAARELGLAISGGSDFHGEAKPNVQIGRECVSMVEVCDLADRATGRRPQPSAS